MENKIYLPNGTEAQIAVYHEPQIEEFRNPLIQALPPMVSKPEIIEKLTRMPPFDPSERNRDSWVRVHLLTRLYDIFTVLPIHLQVWEMIHSLLIQGYLARNPFDKAYKSFVQETGKRIIERTYNADMSFNFRSTASAGTLIGVSGMGKTTTVNQVLRHIPKVLVHNEYNHQHYNQIQLTWVRLETPHNASLKALCLQFFMKVDEILGTDNFRKMVSRNLSTDFMVNSIAQVAQNTKLGVLILDEIQNLTKRGGNQLIDFLVSLINSAGLPILLVGTPSSYALFEGEFRIARRLSGSKEVLWNALKYDKTFRLFLEGIWRYQWLRNYIPLSDELVSAMFEETQGISDLVVKLYLYVQQFSIEHGLETITPEIIRRVANHSFRLMKPMLNALKTGNPYKIAQFDDLRILNAKEPTSSPIPAPPVQKRTNVAKKDTKETRPTTVVEKPKRNVDYREGDLRRCFRIAKQEDVAPETVLEKAGYIDDMTFWTDGGNR
ncbi:ATP-binding protein [Alicyclobacillus mengziensis]|uniref:ATP-binding protein n=1 Tax=Alicyclobacillus mengziensis TaxID=2931921 RepID=A0A9X7W185_9BACL|nr:ATP-binding protein [Alicyclobacillus mengziensis]QSO48505.1 ATP-binding protein [Alicyclobacillus mengziensis]